MRATGLVLLLALAAAAQPPVVTDFVRMRTFKDNIATRIAQYTADEDYAKKPPEEKMLLAFLKGEKKFGKGDLTGKLVVTTCLVNWADVHQAEPTEAGKRVLALLPDVLFERYAKTIDIPKDRKEVARLLVKALDSDFLHIRSAAFDSLKKIYRTQAGFLYVETMSKKERADPISGWKRFIEKQKQ